MFYVAVGYEICHLPLWEIALLLDNRTICGFFFPTQFVKFLSYCFMLCVYVIDVIMEAWGTWFYTQLLVYTTSNA